MGVQPVSEEIYSKAAGGENYRAIEERLGDKIHNFSSTSGLNGERFFCNFQHGIIRGFSASGDELYEWNTNAEGMGRGHAVYDIAFQPPHFMWIAYPTGQTVTKVSLKTKEEVFRIGGFSYEDDYKPLNYPESLYITNEELFIPNMGSGELYRLNLTTMDLRLDRKFLGNLWEYHPVGADEYILLDKDIYRIATSIEG